ncbi:hypothetical protein BAAM0499_03620 [Bifidobacterium animalis subsp. animalis MCC 0499]|uniref:CHAP domain-containing protein n=1 Tax=Bifidobacterium animalis TaxID=28025 RepID=UPI0006995F8C|nr:CHAP domain-containing protein [Bifidobacterium animalis]KOA60969.1 hypothetical protein BAAM0499_03620 [Bifidobacterium animalis subsp. animalis MCC 0499]
MQKRLRRQRRLRQTTGLILLAAVTFTGGMLSMNATAREQSDMTPIPVSRAVTFNASRSQTREPLTRETMSVESTGTWTLGESSHMDAAKTSVAKPTPASSASTGASTVHAASANNPYPYGQCTWWAYQRGREHGIPVGPWWGNAKDWAAAARQAGRVVDDTPSRGSVIVFQPGQDGAHPVYGHVAVVEQVDVQAGRFTISEMNVQGEGVVSTRVLPIGGHTFIH